MRPILFLPLAGGCWYRLHAPPATLMRNYWVTGESVDPYPMFFLQNKWHKERETTFRGLTEGTFFSPHNLRQMFTQPLFKSLKMKHRGISPKRTSFFPLSRTFLKQALECEVIHPQGGGRPSFFQCNERNYYSSWSHAAKKLYWFSLTFGSKLTKVEFRRVLSEGGSCAFSVGMSTFKPLKLSFPVCFLRWIL